MPRHRCWRDEVFLAVGKFDEPSFEAASAAIALDRPQITGETSLRIQVAYLLDCKGILAVGGCRGRPRLVGAATFVPLGALIISLAATSLWASVAVASYAAGSPLGLPGAELLRVPSMQQVALRSLSTSLRRDCTSFITMPGMSSLYIWAGQDAPAPLFDTDWIYFLDSEQQQSIVDQVRSLPGMCVVRNDVVVKFWGQGRPVPSGPLIDFIQTNFVSSGSYGDYELLVPR